MEKTQIEMILAPIINQVNQHNGSLASYKHMDVDIKEAIHEAQESTAIYFAVWLNSNYVRVDCGNRMAYVEKDKGVLVNGSQNHYDRMIKMYGNSIDELFKKWNEDVG